VAAVCVLTLAAGVPVVAEPAACDVAGAAGAAVAGTGGEKVVKGVPPAVTGVLARAVAGALEAAVVAVGDDPPPQAVRIAPPARLAVNARSCLRLMDTDFAGIATPFPFLR